MLPLMYSPLMNYNQLNLQAFLMLQHQYQSLKPKETHDKACQCPDIDFLPTINHTELQDSNPEEQIVTEISELLRYLSKNISLMKEQQFEQYLKDKTTITQALNKDINIPQLIKKRYIQVNKTKEEMTKFIIRRCFLFIKSKLGYQDQEGLPAEERDRIFYQNFFSNDPEFLAILAEHNQTIDDLIPFRKDSKMKTMNDVYLKRLFQSKRFAEFYTEFLNQFKDICHQENEEKIENMTKQMLKIIHTRDYPKIKTYRRFPWKDHELMKCESRARELFQKYKQESDINSQIGRKQSIKQLDMLQKQENCEKTSESVLYQE